MMDTLSRSAPARAANARLLDWTVAVLGIWLIGAVHLDAWAHHRVALETFFTPWHGVLYAGFLALAVVLAGTALRRRRRGEAMSAGYDLSLAGVMVFLAGGVADMIWHTLLGIEVNVEALLSPPHLVLAVGGALIITGPIRSAWARGTGGEVDPAPWPALVALAMLLAQLAFFTAYASPLSEAMLAQGARPATEQGIFLAQGLAVAGILVQTVLLMGVVLVVMGRWRLPFGGFTLVLTLSSLLTVAVHETFRLLPVGLLSGLAADLLYAWLRPAPGRPRALRVFAFTVPAIFYALYFAALALTGGIWWAVHLWTGDILLAGISGWLLSYLMVPPAMPRTRPGEAQVV